jgi:hypothetical protein
MPVADGPREIIQRLDAGQRLRFKDYVVVAEALEFNELHSKSSDEF